MAWTQVTEVESESDEKWSASGYILQLETANLMID